MQNAKTIEVGVYVTQIETGHTLEAMKWNPGSDPHVLGDGEHIQAEPHTTRYA